MFCKAAAVVFVLVCSGLVAADFSSGRSTWSGDDDDDTRVFAAYYANWAQDHNKPYTFLPEDLEGIIGRLDYLIYAFAHFDPHNFKIILTHQNDSNTIAEIMKYKRNNPDLRVLISIGGDQFPSANFSSMVASNSSRDRFIANLKYFVSAHGFDGVDINWQRPCSSANVIFTKKSCNKFTAFYDAGGKCPDDADNLLLFVKHLRKKMSDAEIFVTGSPLQEDYKHLHLSSMSQYIDYWNVETYDYTVSATSLSYLTAPNAPLMAPSSQSVISNQSINSTVAGYLSLGVPASKIIIGVPLFGHTWYVPSNSTESSWKGFGLKASLQGQCCGPHKSSYGGKYARSSQTCGTYMYSEIVAAEVQYYYDYTTQTAIGYLGRDSNDGWSKEGMWFSFSDKNSMKAITEFVNEMELAGTFVFEVSQDSYDFSSNTFTFELMGEIHNGLKKTEGNICNPRVGCNVCRECCKTFLTNDFDCDACVTIQCTGHVCYPFDDCNVCSICCTQNMQYQKDCDSCVKNACH